MTVAECAAIAATWVRENEASMPGYVGAYVGGSTASMPMSAIITGGSDMDVYVVSETPPPNKPGKFNIQGALIEISYISLASIYPSERAARDYHIANSLRHRFILDDPSGKINEIATEISSGFSLPANISARRNHAIQRVISGLTGEPTALTLPDRTLSWLFPTGITTHAILVSALKNPTVRLRYVRSREVLTEHALTEEHETLLDLSGFGDISPESARRHLNALTPVFDCAAKNSVTYFFFKSDISSQSRPAAIDAMESLISQGLHRESMFWIITTWARAMKMLETDAPYEYERYLPDFESLLSDVKRATPAAIHSAAEKVLAHIPTLIQVTDVLIKRCTPK